MTWAKSKISAVAVAIVLLTVQLLNAAPVNFSDADADSIKAFLHDNFARTKPPTCLVIGWVDSQGPRVFAAGKLGNGTGQEANGDTVFFIGSVSKTFTTLLLQDMVERGEMKLEDPVARFLPQSVKMPTRNGREITLLDLATHTAGFPFNPDNMSGRGVKKQYETYTVERMYEFLSSYRLPRDPGTEFQYSNLGMALLGHAIALKAGTNIESLIVNRICRPLGMDSTCIMLTPESKARLVIVCDASDNLSLPKFQAYSPAGGIHSTANDLLKYAAAQAGLTPSHLAGLMEKTHQIRFKDTRGLPDAPGTGSFGRTAMDWGDCEAYQPPGMELLGHGGTAGSYHAWVGFDQLQKRGVVVLSTTSAFSAEAIGWTVLQRLPLPRESAPMIVREIVGLGFSFDLDKQSQTLRVTKVFAKSPAAQAGLTPGLIIACIEDTPTAGKTVAECTALLRANGSPTVRLELINPTSSKTNSVELMNGKFMISG